MPMLQLGGQLKDSLSRDIRFSGFVGKILLINGTKIEFSKISDCYTSNLSIRVQVRTYKQV